MTHLVKKSCCVALLATACQREVTAIEFRRNGTGANSTEKKGFFSMLWGAATEHKAEFTEKNKEAPAATPTAASRTAPHAQGETSEDKPIKQVEPVTTPAAKLRGGNASGKKPSVKTNWMHRAAQTVAGAAKRAAEAKQVRALRAFLQKAGCGALESCLGGLLGPKKVPDPQAEQTKPLAEETREVQADQMAEDLFVPKLSREGAAHLLDPEKPKGVQDYDLDEDLPTEGLPASKNLPAGGNNVDAQAEEIAAPKTDATVPAAVDSAVEVEVTDDVVAATAQEVTSDTQDKEEESVGQDEGEKENVHVSPPHSEPAIEAGVNAEVNAAAGEEVKFSDDEFVDDFAGASDLNADTVAQDGGEEKADAANMQLDFGDVSDLSSNFDEEVAL